MPKKIDPKAKERCVRQVLEHLPEYPSLTSAAEAMARGEGLGKQTVRRWVVQAQIDGGLVRVQPARSVPCHYIPLRGILRA